MHLGIVSILAAMGRPALAQTYPAYPGDLTVTEFMAETSMVANYYGEWFEIYNASGRNLDLDGLEFKGDSEDSGFTIDSSTPLAAGAYLVLGVSGDTTKNGGVDIDWVYDRSDFPLDENSDTITLEYDGVTIDEVGWDSASWPVKKDYAHQANLNAFDLEWANDIATSWCSADNFLGTGLYGTPGTENDWCDGSNTDSDGDGWTEATGDCDDEDAYVNPDAVDGDGGKDEGGEFGVGNDDADCDGVRDDGATDDDGDGYSEVDGDCNDANPAYNPVASEIIDEADNDCNGCVDDMDNDGDGWTECEAWDDKGNPLYDCDDENQLVNPDAIEVPYDGLDNDCIGGDECDVDGDGYEAEECPEESVQYPERDRDCDDGDPGVNPGGDEGDPDEGGTADGKDNDCNGIIDDPYFQDEDGDGVTVSDGDCLDDPDIAGAASVFPGAPELCNDLHDNDCNGLFNDGCQGPEAYATVRGGGLCAAAGGRADALLLLLASSLLAGARRRATAREPRNGA